MAGLSSGDAQAARELRAELLAAVDRHQLAADGLLGRQLRADLQGALVVLNVVEGSRLRRDD